MNRALVPALVASLEAALIILIGLGITLAPLTLVWLLENDPSVPWASNYILSANVWLLAHGVEISVAAGELVGIEFDRFSITAMPLGLTLVTIAMAYRLGRRLSSSGSLVLSWSAGIGSFAALSFFVSQSSVTEYASAVEWQGIISPTVVFATVLILSSLIGEKYQLVSLSKETEAVERVAIRKAMASLKSKLHWSVRTIIEPAVRAGTMTILILLAVSGFVLAYLLAISWIEVIALYEGLQVTILGALIITLAQLALIPNLVIYLSSWFTGSGFAIGVGSSVDPILGTNLGPLPAIPVFAAIPEQSISQGIAMLLVPALSAFIATLLVRKSVADMRWEFATVWGSAISLSLGIAVVAAGQWFLLANLASGAMGPGRLSFVGVDPVSSTLFIFAEVFTFAFLASVIAARPVDQRQR